MDPILRWFSNGVFVVNLLLALRYWWRKRKGIVYEPLTRLKLNE